MVVIPYTVHSIVVKVYISVSRGAISFFGVSNCYPNLFDSESVPVVQSMCGALVPPESTPES